MKNNNIKIMYLIALLQGMVFYGSIATLYRTSAGLTLYQISIIESISYILTICFEFPWGIIADKIGYKKTMVICSFIYFLSKFVFFAADSFFLFLLERIMLSAVFAGLSGVDSSIIFLSSEEGKSQKAFSIYGTLGTAGMLISALVTAIFIPSNYRLTGLLTIFPYAIAAVLTLFLKEVKETNHEEKQSFHMIKESIKDILGKREFLFLVLSAGLMSESMHMITVFLNQPKYASTGMSSSMISFVFAGMAALSLLEIFSDKLTHRHGQAKTGFTLFLIMFIAAVVMGITGSSIVAVTSVALIEITYSIFQPLLNSREHEMIHSAQRATVYSAAAVIMDVVAAGVDMIMGKIADISVNGSILCGSGFIFIGMLMFLYSSKASHSVKE